MKHLISIIPFNSWELNKFERIYSSYNEWEGLEVRITGGYRALYQLSKFGGNIAVNQTAPFSDRFQYALKKTGLDAFCGLHTDIEIILSAFVFLKKTPEAQKMLWHYLTGESEEVEIDTSEVFKDEPKVKLYVMLQVAKCLNKGSKDYTVNTINITQSQYSNDKWKMAFGSVNIRWEKRGSRISIWLEDLYKWHPNEPRSTQCVHMAMERAKKYGAKEFKYHGSKLWFNEKDFEKYRLFIANLGIN